MFFAIMAVSGTPSNEKGVEGAWQYVSGSYVSGDSTTTLTSDDLKSIKIYGDNLFINGIFRCFYFTHYLFLL